MCEYVLVRHVDAVEYVRQRLRECVVFDEEDEDGRILVHTKSNYARNGPSIKYRIENGGVVWNGFSKITRQTLEEASRRHKTPGEIAREHDDSVKTNNNLFRALMSVASPKETVRFTYECFKEHFGERIFGLSQPKKALEAVSVL